MLPRTAAIDLEAYRTSSATAPRSRAGRRQASNGVQVFERLGAASHASRVQEIVAAARELLNMDIAYSTQHTDTEQIVQYLDGDGASFGLDASTSVPLELTHCQRILEGRLPRLIPDVQSIPEAASMAAGRAVVVGAFVSVPLPPVEGRPHGTLCCAAHEAHPDLTEEDVHLVRALAALIADGLRRESAVAEQVYPPPPISAAARVLLVALKERDLHTADHCEAVRSLVAQVVRRLGLDEAEAAAAEQVALLHDLGKIAVSDEILHKPAPLDEQEWDLMRRHPSIGTRILSKFPEFAHLSEGVHAEHERWDGLGYPRALSGEEIPPTSRIVSVCDSFCAMTVNQPYRQALSRAEALCEVADGIGSQFCPDAASALLSVLLTP